MIAVHLIIYAAMLSLILGLNFRQIQVNALKETRTRRRFFLIILVGNSIGLVLTIQNGTGQKYENGYRIEKKENYSEQYEIKAYIEDGETETKVQFLVPEKAAEEQEQENQIEKEADVKQTIENEIRRYNQNLDDENYYYLPEYINGRKVIWKEKDDLSGSMLAVMFLLSGISILVFYHREQEQYQKKREQELLYDYPEIVMKFSVLIQAGMTVRSAFMKIAADYAKKSVQKREAYEEMLNAVRELEGGMAEAEVYVRFGERCQYIKYRTFASLIVQNLQRGNAGLTELLERESSEAWEERKRNVRILGEKAVTRLLIPMIMMLVVVVVIIMVPSFLSFYGT